MLWMTITLWAVVVGASCFVSAGYFRGKKYQDAILALGGVTLAIAAISSAFCLGIGQGVVFLAFAVGSFCWFGYADWHEKQKSKLADEKRRKDREWKVLEEREQHQQMLARQRKKMTSLQINAAIPPESIWKDDYVE